MAVTGKTVLLCNCEATMPVDARAVAAALGMSTLPVVHTQLCRSQIAAFQNAVAGDVPVLVGCTRQAPLFAEAAEDLELETPVAFTDIRERAGWSRAAVTEPAQVTAKMAALIAEAALDILPARSVTMASEGSALIYGIDERAIEAARQLRERLDVTVLLSRPRDVAPPSVFDIPIFKGTIRTAKGHLGAFEITVDDYAPVAPSSRKALIFEPPRNDAASVCDLILDLSGGAPLFPAHDRREGYLRPDPGNPAAVQKAIFELSGLVGEFDKPLYVDFRAELCAHSRSRKTGCTRCLDICPTSAIRSAGDVVEIDPFACGGCGACAGVCPTGAASYALPAPEAMHERLRVLLATFAGAGGSEPVLLVHDRHHGADLVDLIARQGGGLPGRVVPFTVNEVTQLGFDFLATGLAYGAAAVAVLAGPSNRDERAGLEQQIGLAEAALSGLGYGTGRARLIETDDPDTLEALLHGIDAGPAPRAGSFLPMGKTRSVAMLALRHLHDVAPAPVDRLPLTAGSPFGAVVVDHAGCTLCLSCVGACPTGALIDDPDRPRLAFQEDACVQCGLCRTTCPEQVITLESRFSFTDAARGTVILKEEEPATCLRCGKPFGTRSSVEKIARQLAGKHSMFATGEAADRIRMCDTCRIETHFATAHPLAGAPRAAIRTSEDYFKERKDSGTE